MSLYNIVYTSADKINYLWSGEQFHKLRNTGNETLYFSGKTFKHDELAKELKTCREAVTSFFPNDVKPLIMPVEVVISK